MPREAWLTLCVISLAIIAEAAFRALLPMSAGFLIDRSPIAHEIENLTLVAAVLGGGLVAASLAGIIRDRLYSRLYGRSLANLRQSMYERLQQLSLSFHSHADPGVILDRFSEDIAHFGHAVSGAVSRSVLPGLEALLCSVLMFWLDWRIGLLGLLYWPWILLSPRTMARQAVTAAENCREEEVRILGIVDESLRARHVIRAFSLEHGGISVFRKRLDLLMRGETKTALRIAAMERLSGTGVLALRVAVLLFSIWLARNSGVSVGAVVSVQLLAAMLARALTQCTEYVPVLKESTDAWCRIQEDLSDPAPVLDKPDAGVLPPMQNEILFSGVSCIHHAPAKPALAGVTLRIPRGASVALVGAEGSGKSSMLRLLLRFIDPDSGMVSIDGHDLRQVTQSSLRNRVSVVLRENFVFNASLSENIRLGNAGASEETLRDAARAAGIEQFAAALPKGFETPAGPEGIPLDSETVQRLALARALLRNPDVLLFDNAASALDALQEVSFNTTLREVGKGRTVVSVTHRLASVSDADRIYLFEAGHIAEQGSHSELMAMEGHYARLWSKQSGFRFSPDGTHVDVDIARLQQFPIFENLPDEVACKLAPFFATETFPAGRDIVVQNDPGDKFYIVARGRAAVWRSDRESGDSSKTGVLLDGDFFGEITLISGFPRTATVRTETVCTCISLERAQFDREIDRYPDLRRKLSEIAVQRLRGAHRTLTARAG